MNKSNQHSEPNVEIYKCKLCNFQTNRVKIIEEHDKLVHKMKSSLDRNVTNSKTSSSNHSKQISPPTLSRISASNKFPRSSVNNGQVHNLKEPFIIIDTIDLSHTDDDEPEVKSRIMNSASVIRGNRDASHQSAAPNRQVKRLKRPNEKMNLDFTRFKNDVKCCLVCLKKRPEVSLEKIRRIDHELVDKLRKFNHTTTSMSTTNIIDFLISGNGNLKIPIYFCLGCQEKIEKFESFIEDLKKADKFFGRIASFMLSLSCAVIGYPNNDSN